MVTEDVIQEIYSRYKKPAKNREELNLPYFFDILKKHHSFTHNDMEVVLNDLEEFNPFRRFLIRSLAAVLEFDKVIAFVFPNHILFLDKDSEDLRVHLRPEKPKGFFSRLFGR